MIARCLRQLVLLLVLAAIPAGISAARHWHAMASPPAAPSRESELSVQAVRASTTKFLWVDARVRAQFDRGHIPGAILLNEAEWEALAPAFLDAWEPGTPILVYCDGGDCDASHAVAKRIAAEFNINEAIHVLQGGWQAWQQNP